MWDRIVRQCEVRTVRVTPPLRVGRPVMSLEQRDELFRHNMQQIDVMHVPAGSLVKGLVMELERRGTYIRLYDPVPDGHVVQYEVVQGVKCLVVPIARALGFKKATASMLQVRNG